MENMTSIELQRLEREADQVFTKAAWSSNPMEKKLGERGCLLTAAMRDAIMQLERCERGVCQVARDRKPGQPQEKQTVVDPPEKVSAEDEQK